MKAISECGELLWVMKKIGCDGNVLAGTSEVFRQSSKKNWKKGVGIHTRPQTSGGGIP